MHEVDAGYFHKLYGVKKPRIAYQEKDFPDYLLMVAISAVLIHLAYGAARIMEFPGLVLCAVMLAMFPVRHGIGFGVPVLLKRPQDALYMFLYKVQNMTFMYLVGVATLLLQSCLVHITPNWPHHVEWMHALALGLFYFHFAAICLYRTASLVDHLRKKALVREVLMQTAWKGQMTRQPNTTVEILHAYVTGLLTHIVLLAPWFIIIGHFQFSLLFLPVMVVVNVFTHLQYLKAYNNWFYRDHWLGHNAELDFLYLHGTHHDAIPSGLIGVSGNGFLEGFLRHTLGHPTPFYNPVVAFLLYTMEVQSDIQNHQYIPGVFPKVSRRFHEICQHSTHHFGRLEPYSVALKSDPPPAGAGGASREFQIIPDAILNSIGLDERLTGFRWDNPRYRQFLELFDKYQK